MNCWFPQRLAQFAALFLLGRKLGRVFNLSSSDYFQPVSHVHESSCLRWLLCFAAGVASSVAAIPDDTRHGASPMSAAERDFVRAAEPLFKQFCFDCHGNKKTKAGVNLQHLSVDP